MSGSLKSSAARSATTGNARRIDKSTQTQREAAAAVASHVVAAKQLAASHDRAQEAIESDPRHAQDQEIALAGAEGRKPKIITPSPELVNDESRPPSTPATSAATSGNIAAARPALVPNGASDGKEPNSLEKAVASGATVGGAEGKAQSDIKAADDAKAATTQSAGAVIK